MTDTHDPQSLSNLQLLVLARLSCSDGANEGEVADMLAEVAPPDGLQSARDYAMQALDVLQRRSLATRSKPTKRAPNPRSHITEEGRRALRAAFGPLGRSPWGSVRSRMPALGLEVSNTFDQTSKRHIHDEVALALLRQRFNIPQASTAVALCDALIARKLGLTGSLTLLRLRAYVLAHDLGIDPTVNSTKELGSLVRRAADKILDEVANGTRSLRQVLGQRWAYRAIGSAMVLPGPLPVAPTTTQARPNLHAVPDGHLDQRASGRPVGTFISTAVPPRAPGPIATPADIVLTLVREAIPRIGADGRFGDENVFVSAIWQYLEDDGRLTDWSLDRFKRWLVTANADQLLDLARADAQGDMDSRLVEDSEIIDRGATFHFVVDRQALNARRGIHAR